MHLSKTSIVVKHSRRNVVFLDGNGLRVNFCRLGVRVSQPPSNNMQWNAGLDRGNAKTVAQPFGMPAARDCRLNDYCAQLRKRLANQVAVPFAPVSQQFVADQLLDLKNQSLTP